MDLLVNPDAHAVLDAEPPDRAPLALHRTLPGYAPTPLRDVSALADAGTVLAKDETSRFGLPAFKIMGASWAVLRALELHRGAPLHGSLEVMAEALAGSGLTLVAATDGNHGRAVARMAALLGLAARIYVPADMVSARRRAIEQEGAELRVVDDDYDAAVERSAADAGPRHLVVSDTAWPGYEAVPQAVIDGYSTILWEIDDELAARGEPGPDVVLVPVGVGALATAVARHFRRPGLESPPRIVAVEPTGAACLLASARAARPVTLDHAASIMSGLVCGTPSPLAWPVLRHAVDAFVAVEDDVARAGMRALAGLGLAVGECSGGTAGALAELERSPTAVEALGLGPDARVLLFLTEGVTDPVGYEEIVGGAFPRALDPSP